MKTKSEELKEFNRLKQLVIKELTNKKCTIHDLIALTGLRGHNIHSMIQRLREHYNVEATKHKGNGFYYKITGECEEIETVKTLYDTVPLSNLPRKMYKGDLLTWHLVNQIYKVETSKQLVEIAKQSGIKVYERSFRGEVYYI